MRIHKKLALFLTALALSANSWAVLMVDDTSTDYDAIATSLLGTGVTLSGPASFTGDDSQIGSFTGGTSMGVGLGIDTGIILSSGRVADAPGPNSDDGFTTAFGGPGDPALDAIVGLDTFDAAILTFSFETTTGDLFFDYIFASDEYNEFIDGGVNDVFALFVDGMNIAIAPNGDFVSIDTVNCGDPFGSADDNCSSFNNNDLDDGGPFFDLEYDGFTDTFTASILGLAPGTHTFTAAIADAGDEALDSAVFIAGGSFSSTDPTLPPTTPPSPIPEPGSLLLLGLGLAGLRYSRKRI